MTEEVRNKLREFFEARLEESRIFYAVIRDYFSERLTDLQLPNFSEFERRLGDKRLEYFIGRASDSNRYGGYSMDEDYYRTHRSSPFVDSITDLGIIDYCTMLLTEEMPDTNILIKFPEVRVTNEQDRSVNIKDLYVQLRLKGNKMRGTFRMIRTTYDVIQWLSRYSHSHIPRISSSDVPSWSSPCLGTGPLNTTLSRLREVYDEEFLGLFCFELSKYVTVESLAGVPYIKLESIGANNGSYVTPFSYRGYWDAICFPMDEFVKHFLKSVPIKFSYVNGNYALGEPLLDFWIKMSNCFINWYNDMYRQGKVKYTLQALERRHVVDPFIISEGKACTPISDISIEHIQSVNHANMFVFKGVMQKLNIEGTNNLNQNQSILLSNRGCEYILTSILKLINCKYGRTNSEEGEAEPSKKCFYL